MMTPNDLPLLSSNFFKNHLLAACPPDKNVDVKKSRHKKLSVFLAYMKTKGIIDTSIMKGVETLLSIKVILKKKKKQLTHVFPIY